MKLKIILILNTQIVITSKIKQLPSTEIEKQKMMTKSRIIAKDICLLIRIKELLFKKTPILSSIGQARNTINQNFNQGSLFLLEAISQRIN